MSAEKKEQVKDDKSTSHKEQTKKSYTPPNLKIYGDVTELTQGASGSGIEGGFRPP